MKNSQKIKQLKRLKRAKCVRAKIFGTKTRPRLSIYRSLKHVYAQAVNDEKGETLAAVSDFELPVRRGKHGVAGGSLKQKKKNKIEMAKEIGGLIAKKLEDKKINKVVFDRRGYKYHGVVKAFADAVREGGITF